MILPEVSVFTGSCDDPEDSATQANNHGREECHVLVDHRFVEK